MGYCLGLRQICQGERDLSVCVCGGGGDLGSLLRTVKHLSHNPVSSWGRSVHVSTDRGLWKCLVSMKRLMTRMRETADI